jgi:hypothetical protein
MIIFGSVQFLTKKIIEPFFFKKNQNRFKPIGFYSVRFGFLEQKPVETGLARFFQFWLGFFWFGSFCSVRFQTCKTGTEPVGFFKILIGLIGFFFTIWSFQLFFSGFLGLIGFLVFLLTPILYNSYFLFIDASSCHL